MAYMDVCIIQYQPKEIEQLSPAARMALCWKDNILPKTVTVNAYVFILSMDS